MKILVCISQVSDTTTRIKLTADQQNVDNKGVQWIINPWDELALTRALELKEDNAPLVDKVDVIMVGPVSYEPTMRKALAMGADEGWRIDCEPTDAWFVANKLAAFIKEKSDYDLVMAGIESSDFNGAAVGGMTAKLSDYNCVTSVSSINIDEGYFNMRREILGGFETLHVMAPVMAIVQKGIAIHPRIPAMRGIMMARRKPIHIVSAEDFQPATMLVNYALPTPRGKVKLFAPGHEKELIQQLHEEAKVI